MQLTRQEVLNLMDGIDSVGSIPGSFAWGYAVAKTRRLIQPEVDAIREAIEPPNIIQVYNQKRLDLCETHCVRDCGIPRIIDSHYAIDPEKQVEFDEKLHALREEFKEPIDKWNMQQVMRPQFLAEQVDVPVYQIDFDQAPELNPRQIDQLMPIFREIRDSTLRAVVVKH